MKLAHIPALYHCLGPKWVLTRALLTAQHKAGILRRRSAPVPLEEYRPKKADENDFAEQWRKYAPKLPVAQVDAQYAGRHIRKWDLQSCGGLNSKAAGIRKGEFQFFSGATHFLGVPTKWHHNVVDSVAVPAHLHWSELPDFGFGDIKMVWEPSRFSWAFTLARAWLADGDPLHVETFWQLVEHWAQENPPNYGPNWKCGQEAAFRLFALAFALNVFHEAEATTDARIALVARLAEATGRRIEAHINYALSQGNNHGVSEAVGLITAGGLWPMLNSSGRWLTRGIEFLDQQVHSLVYEDGGFSQHSTNYHRLLLQDLLWSHAVLSSIGKAFSDDTKARAVAASRFLYALMESNGRVHRYGADDGADLFPLSSCEYDDFRPVVGAALATFCNEHLSPGPWDEAKLLLCGYAREKSCAADCPENSRFPDAGVYLTRSGLCSALLRAPTRFRHRPSHADQLHMDIWLESEPVAEDPGTFSYNAPGPMGHGMKEAKFHNTVQVGGTDPMESVSRFLWLPWTECHIWECAHDKVQAWHDGYKRLPTRVRVARTMLSWDGGIIVIDRITGKLEENFVLRWHGRSRERLGRLAIQCTAQTLEEWISADEQTGEGWYSSHYGQRTPSWCRRCSARGKVVFFVTTLNTEVKLYKDHLVIGSRDILLSPDPGEPILPVGDFIQ